MPQRDDTKLTNSDFLNGMSYTSGAMAAAIEKLEGRSRRGKGMKNQLSLCAMPYRTTVLGRAIPCIL
jgi:leucyl-tRNA synthetase